MTQHMHIAACLALGAAKSPSGIYWYLLSSFSGYYRSISKMWCLL